MKSNDGLAKWDRNGKIQIRWGGNGGIYEIEGGYGGYAIPPPLDSKIPKRNPHFHLNKREKIDSPPEDGC